MTRPVKQTTTTKPRDTASTTPARAAARPRALSAKPRATTAKAAAIAAKPRASAGRTPESAPTTAFEPSHDLIAARAFDLFERSGQPHGRDVEFWLEAERQVKSRLKT